MKNLSALTFLICLFQISCNHQKEIIVQNEIAVVCGTIPNNASTPNVISISYIADDFRSAYLSEITDNSGNFRFELSIPLPHVAYLKTHAGILPIYIAPKDSMSINLDAFINANLPFIITGNNSLTSRNILEYLRFFDPNKFFPDPAEKSVDQYLALLKGNIEREDSILKEFNIKVNASDEFKNWAAQDIIYRNANFLEDYKFHHFINKTKFSGELYNTTLFPIDYPNPISSVSYYTYLWNYSMYKYIEKDTSVLKLYKQGLISESYKICFRNITEKEKKGLNRDLMIYTLTTDVLNRSREEFINSCSVALSYIKNHDLRSKLINKKTIVETEKNFSVSKLDASSNQEKEIIGDFFSNLTSAFPNKTLYVDLWAVWCGPCRMEFLHAPIIHNYFKDKPVVFVNICLSSDKSEWIKTLKSLKISGENYYFEKAQTELLRSKLKYAGLPTYLIIDKNGDIVTKFAPSPSQKDTLIKLLDSHINK